jgi:hypothetical protein
VVSCLSLSCCSSVSLNGVITAALPVLILFVVLLFELVLKLHFPLLMQNSNTKHICRVYDIPTTVSDISFKHCQLRFAKWPMS